MIMMMTIVVVVMVMDDVDDNDNDDDNDITKATNYADNSFVSISVIYLTSI
jgi:hypothetical protein